MWTPRVCLLCVLIASRVWERMRERVRRAAGAVSVSVSVSVFLLVPTGGADVDISSSCAGVVLPRERVRVRDAMG